MAIEQTNLRWEGFPSDVLVDLRPQQGRGLRERLEHGLRAAIQSRRLVAGAALPPTRVLAAELGISRSVVVAAYANLRADGYLEARQGAGTRVRLDERHDGAPTGAPCATAGARSCCPRWRRSGRSAACPIPPSSPAPSGSGTTAPRWRSCPTGSSPTPTRAARRRCGSR